MLVGLQGHHGQDLPCHGHVWSGAAREAQCQEMETALPAPAGTAAATAPSDCWNQLNSSSGGSRPPLCCLCRGSSDAWPHGTNPPQQIHFLPHSKKMVQNRVTSTPSDMPWREHVVQCPQCHWLHGVPGIAGCVVLPVSLVVQCPKCHCLCGVPTIASCAVSPASLAVRCLHCHQLHSVPTIAGCAVSPPSPAVRGHQLAVSDALATAPSAAGQCSRVAQTRLFK